MAGSCLIGHCCLPFPLNFKVLFPNIKKIPLVQSIIFMLIIQIDYYLHAPTLHHCFTYLSAEIEKAQSLTFQAKLLTTG